MITDDTVLARPSFDDDAAAILRAGGDRIAFHLRGPRTSGARLYGHAATLAPAARSARAKLIVNDRVDVARAARAHGVQLGARSLDPRAARRAWPDAWIGTSVHAADGAAAAVEAGTDFLVLGTIYSTASHPGHPGDGASLVRATVDAVGAPVVAIGGISEGRVAEVAAAGAAGVAVLGAVWHAADPADAVTDLLDAWERRAKGS